ncbi:hypothetical protein [Brassicibacter mesophilus]|uniref:hypothetical protein n=1 Tax=Brassicibacter mesophilus TaxID=745119 RepID=UPI003D1FBECC
MKRSILVILIILLGIMLVTTEVFAHNEVTFEIKNGQFGIKNLKEDSREVTNGFFERYRGFIVGVTGLGALTMIVMFIINFIRLGVSAGNPQTRTQAIKALFWTGISATGLGGITIWAGFFYNAI